MSIEKVIEGIRKLEAERTEYKNKLKDIKTHFENRPKSMVSPPLRSNIASIGYDDKAVHKWFQEFKALLGVEE